MGDYGHAPANWRNRLPKDLRRRIINELIKRISQRVPNINNEKLSEEAVDFEARVLRAASRIEQYICTLTAESTGDKNIIVKNLQVASASPQTMVGVTNEAGLPGGELLPQDNRCAQNGILASVPLSWNGIGLTNFNLQSPDTVPEVDNFEAVHGAHVPMATRSSAYSLIHGNEQINRTGDAIGISDFTTSPLETELHVPACLYVGEALDRELDLGMGNEYGHAALQVGNDEIPHNENGARWEKVRRIQNRFRNIFSNNEALQHAWSISSGEMREKFDNFMAMSMSLAKVTDPHNIPEAIDMQALREVENFMRILESSLCFSNNPRMERQIDGILATSEHVLNSGDMYKSSLGKPTGNARSLQGVDGETEVLLELGTSALDQPPSQLMNPPDQTVSMPDAIIEDAVINEQHITDGSDERNVDAAHKIRGKGLSPSNLACGNITATGIENQVSFGASDDTSELNPSISGVLLSPRESTAAAYQGAGVTQSNSLQSLPCSAPTTMTQNDSGQPPGAAPKPPNTTDDHMESLQRRVAEACSAALKAAENYEWQRKERIENTLRALRRHQPAIGMSSPHPNRSWMNPVPVPLKLKTPVTRAEKLEELRKKVYAHAEVALDELLMLGIGYQVDNDHPVVSCKVNLESVKMPTMFLRAGIGYPAKLSTFIIFRPPEEKWRGLEGRIYARFKKDVEEYKEEVLNVTNLLRMYAKVVNEIVEESDQKTTEG